MLKQRIITALLLIPLAIGWMFFLPLPFFTLGAVVLFLLAGREWGRFVFSERPYRILFPLALLLVLSLWLEPPSQLLRGTIGPVVQTILYSGAIWWCLSLAMVLKYPRWTSWWQKNPWFKGCFGVLTLLPFFWSLLLLRSYDYTVHAQLGGWILFLVMLLVWCADSGAYFVGRTLGRHKMLPAVSPKKTVEGLLGGLFLSACVAAYVAFACEFSFHQSLVLVISSVMAVLASVLGDLSESLFKREAGIKDSGSLLPGHGGVLDRIDSLTSALPVFVVSNLLLS